MFLKLKIDLIAIVFSFILGITVCYFAVQQMLNALSSDIYRLELKLIEIVSSYYEKVLYSNNKDGDIK